MERSEIRVRRCGHADPALRFAPCGLQVAADCSRVFVGWAKVRFTLTGRDTRMLQRRAHHRFPHAICKEVLRSAV